VKWTDEKLVLLGYWAGQGKTADQVAQKLGTDKVTVLRKADYCSLPLSSQPSPLRLDVRLPAEVWEAFRSRSAKTGLPPEIVMRQILCVCAADPELIRNILD